MLSNLASDVRNFVSFDDNSAENDEANESWSELGEPSLQRDVNKIDNCSFCLLYLIVCTKQVIHQARKMYGVLGAALLVTGKVAKNVRIQLLKI